MYYNNVDKEVFEVLGLDINDCKNYIPRVYDDTTYSTNSPEHMKVEGKNVSSVIDQLIRVTAKCTECYASDIIYDINALNAAVENDVPMMRFLMFRDYGVSTCPIYEYNSVRYILVGEMNTEEMLNDAIQCYALVYKDGVTTLDRVKSYNSQYNNIMSVDRLNEMVRRAERDEKWEADREWEKYMKDKLFYDWEKQMDKDEIESMKRENRFS